MAGQDAHLPAVLEIRHPRPVRWAASLVYGAAIVAAATAAILALTDTGVWRDIAAALLVLSFALPLLHYDTKRRTVVHVELSEAGIQLLTRNGRTYDIPWSDPHFLLDIVGSEPLLNETVSTLNFTRLSLPVIRVTRESAGLLITVARSKGLRVTNRAPRLGTAGGLLTEIRSARPD